MEIFLESWLEIILLAGGFILVAALGFRATSQYARISFILIGLAGMVIWGWMWSANTRIPGKAREAFLNTVPEPNRPGGYVSSQQCRSCHPSEYDSWHRTFHRTMTQVAGNSTVVASFDDQILYDDDFAYKLVHEHGKYFVEVYTFPVGVAPDLNDENIPRRLEGRYRVGLLTGSHHMQVCWLTSPEGNLQKLFPFAWLIEDNRWVHRDDVFLRDPSIKHGQQLWNQNCYRCHSTAAQPRLDTSTGLAHTRTAETGIGCEACHGPGEEHIRLYANPVQRYSTSLSDGVTAHDHRIVHPGTLDHTRSSQVCGQCHSVKWFQDGPELWEEGFTYRPGDDLEQSTPVVRPTRLEDQPWLQQIVTKSPEKLEKQFWPDGQVRVSGREFNGMIESGCYQNGTMSCLSCHQMHGAPPKDQLAAGMATDRACTQCHQDISQNISAHTHHSPESSGSACFNCHMPHTTYGLLTAMRSHHIDSPSVTTQLESTRPNACSLCHLDKPLEWTAQSLNRLYGHPIPDLDEDMKSVPEGLRLGLSGGPQQRATIAWHLTWKPALEASRASWFPALSIELFQDRYSAIRYIAAKAIDLHFPSFERPDYVSTVPERIRIVNQLKDSLNHPLDTSFIRSLQDLQPVNPVDLGE